MSSDSGGAARGPAAAGRTASEDEWGTAGGLFGPLFGSPEVDALTSDAGWLRALLRVEAALARAGAAAGLVPGEVAEEIARACREANFDPGSIGRRATGAGNPVVPLVEALRSAVSERAQPHVHRGATSQDVLDCAAMLVAREALGAIAQDLAGAADRCAGLAEEHRHTLMPARTLLQQALPTTFGLRCAGWLTALDQVRDGLDRVGRERLALQLGGAAGTLASLGDDGPQVASALAAELALAEPVIPWHTDRTRIAELAAALGVAAGALGKVALDVELLAQTEVAEVGEGGAGRDRGGSSTLPQKRNPVRAVLVRAAAIRAPGLVATLLSTMAQEHERAAGAWHAEWPALTELLRVTGAAAFHARRLLDGLHVDAAGMRRHLDDGGGMVMAERVADRLSPHLGRTEAQNLVRGLAERARAHSLDLGSALRGDTDVRLLLTDPEIDELMDPAGYLGATQELIDRALDHHRARGAPGADATTGSAPAASTAPAPGSPKP